MADLKKIVQILIQSKNQAGPGIQQAAKQVSDLGTKALDLGGVLTGLGAAFSVAAVAGFVKSQIDAADAIRDLSQRSGIAVETLSEYKYVADQTGTSVESLARATKILAKGAFDAANGSGEAADKFKRFGIAVNDSNGKLKSTNDLILDVSKAIQGLGESEQIAASVDLLGRNGPELLEFLRLGPEAIKKFAAEGHKIGAIITKEEADRADSYNDKLRQLTVSVGALARDLGIALLPALTKIAQAFLDAATATRHWYEEHPQASKGVESLLLVLGESAGLVFVLRSVSAAFGIGTLAAGNFWKALLGPIGIAVTLIATLSEIARRTDEIAKKQRELGLAPSQQVPSSADATGVPGGKPAGGSFDPLKSLAGDPFDRILPADTSAKVAAGIAKVTTAGGALEDQLKNINDEVAKFALPAKLREALIELAKFRKVRPEELLPIAALNAKELEDFKNRPLTKVKPPGPKEKKRADVGPPNELEQPDLTITDPILENQQERQSAFDQMAGNLLTLRQQALGLGQDVSYAFGSVVYGFLTGAKAAESFGVAILKAVASAIASLAAMIAQLVIVNALMSIFGGGVFKPFEGIKKVLGLAEGGVVGGPGGRDAAGPVMLTRGELVTPAPLTARLESFLSQQSGNFAMAGGGNSYQINVNSAFATKGEKLAIAREIRDHIEELDGKRR